MVRTLTLCLFAAALLLPSARAHAQPNLPCPLEVIYDGIDRPLLVAPELWGDSGIRVSANPENPAPVTLVFVSKEGVVLEAGQISVHPGSAVIVGSTQDLAILVRTHANPDFPPGALCAEPVLPEGFETVSVIGGCGGNVEHKSVRAEGWVSATVTVPTGQRCPVDVILEAEHPETGARTVITRTRAIPGGAAVVEAYTPPPGYRGPTPFLRVRVECPFEPDQTCEATISGGFVPAADPHAIAFVFTEAACAGAVFDAQTSVPAVFDLAVSNPQYEGFPSCPVQINIAFQGLPNGVPQPFPEHTSLDAGEFALFRLDNTIFPNTTLTISVVCFFSPDGTCQPLINLTRGGLRGLEHIYVNRQCAEDATAPFAKIYTDKPVKVSMIVPDDSCPVTLFASHGAGAPKKIVTVSPGDDLIDREVKPTKAKGTRKKDHYEVLTLHTKCERASADVCYFLIEIE